MSRTNSTPGRQRPGASYGPARDTARDASIIEAVLDLLAEHGYADLTMAAVAARAGVAKATVYRRWASREDLVADALETLLLQGQPDAGESAATLREDLVATLIGTTACGEPRGRRFATVLAATAPAHPQIAATLRERYVAAQRSGIAACLHRAQARGELSLERVEHLLAADRLEIASAIALMLVHDSLFGAPLDADGVARLVDQVLLPLLAGPGA
ncbi:TetR family transcriptional regulator [Streptomyces sp. NA02950]|uniref:TetR-like C-terminal domain-containing protein n=1 Tax=Streptomyces sp. NA02950 TaxID=2742137 RepID=UPI00159131DD|nr:TetR-like C-terminal domain-containing protein [Streptomyces sp. NA02950]QKV90490.1 TetR family transcriptional regulator [Streptomyces sp. NA02950]